MNIPFRTHPPVIWKGVLAGVVGGAVASYVMTLFQEAVPAETFAKLLGEQPKKEGEGDDATEKTAEAISEGVFDHELTKKEKEEAGPAVHYAFGTSLGALYGGLAEAVPPVAAGLGMPYGTAVWLGADEAAVPALGLAPAPTETPPSTHVYAFASHLVYGLTLDLVRRGVRAALG